MNCKEEALLQQLKSSILTPGESEQQINPQQNKINMNKLKRKTDLLIEDGLKVFKFQRRFLIADFSLSLTIFSYFVLLIYYFESELRFYHEAGVILIWAVFFTSLLAVICTTIRFLVRNQLAQARSQRKIAYFYLTAELILIIIQPYSWINQIFLPRTTRQLEQLKPIKLNYILLMLAVGKIFFLIRGSINFITFYGNPRHYRLGNIYGIQNDLFLNLKCLFRQRPVILVSILYIASLMIFAYFFRVCDFEVPIEYSSKYFASAIWLAVLTMTSVGFGDIVPITIYGSVITIISCFTGAIATSLFVLSITNHFSLNYGQEMALIFLETFEKKKSIKIKSAMFIRLCLWRIWKQKKFRKILSISAQQRQLRRELWELRLQIKKSLARSSILQSNIQHEFRAIRKQIRTILVNCDLIIQKCTWKDKILDGVIESVQNDHKQAVIAKQKQYYREIRRSQIKARSSPL